jgi:isochorismate hydrolase
MSKGRYSESEIQELMRNAYENDFAAFPVHINDCALLVIDMQDEFVKPNWTSYWVPEATRQVPRINDMIVFCHENNISVILTAFSDTYQYLDRPKTGRFMPNRYITKVPEPDRRGLLIVRSMIN